MHELETHRSQQFMPPPCKRGDLRRAKIILPLRCSFDNSHAWHVAAIDK